MGDSLRHKNLVKNPGDYGHSSAKYYITGQQGNYLIKDE
jgi:hypothetical protein